MFILRSTSSCSHGRKMFSPNSSSAAVDYCVSQIASNDIRFAIISLRELEDHFKANGPNVWLKHLNQVSLLAVLFIMQLYSVLLYLQSLNKNTKQQI